MDTEQRLADLESRMAAVEGIVQDAMDKAAAFAAGPGKKVLAMLGVKL